jgi:hypothetical protein
MIGQYLSNNNEKSYSTVLQKKKNLNRPLLFFGSAHLVLDAMFLRLCGTVVVFSDSARHFGRAIIMPNLKPRAVGGDNEGAATRE